MPAEFEVKLRRVGNGLVVSIPTPAHKGLEWSEGDKLKLVVSDQNITLQKREKNSNHGRKV